MADGKLSVAVIGLGGFGRGMLHALLDSDQTDVVGVSDRNPEVAKAVGTETGLPHFTDNRFLLVHKRPEAAFLATPPMAGAELVALCAKLGIHVWKEQPLARNLDEGLEMVRRMDAAKLKLAVGTQRRFAGGYRRAREVRQRLGQVFLARGHYLFNWGAELDWRGDRASAGGGALLELGYHLVDLLTWMLGLPEEVYGISACQRRPARDGPAEQPKPAHDTDDSGAALLRYNDGGMASLMTTRTSGPVSEELSLHGQGGSITATSERCLLRDPDGNVLDHVQESPPPVALFRRQADAFLRAVIDGKPHYPCSGRENVLNLAVLDALYLADRTSQPEQPHELLRQRGTTLAECLTYSPDEHEEDPPGAK